MRARVQGQGLGGCKVMAMTALCRQLVVLVLVVLVVLVFLDDLVPPRLPGVDGVHRTQCPSTPPKPGIGCGPARRERTAGLSGPPKSKAPPNSRVPRRAVHAGSSDVVVRSSRRAVGTGAHGLISSPRSLLRVRGC